MAGIGKGNTLSLTSILPSDKRKGLALNVFLMRPDPGVLVSGTAKTHPAWNHIPTPLLPLASHPHSPHVEGDISLPLIPMRAFDALLGIPDVLVDDGLHLSRPPR